MKKVERNDPCPCGSGKKYKQCCMKHDEALATNSRAETASISNFIQQAIEHHQAGRLSQAEALYQQILQIDPDQPDALHLSGLIAHQVGKNDQAVELIGKAIKANSSNPSFYSNLGAALESQGKLEAAAENYRQALLLKPDYAKAHFNLGNVLKEQGKFDKAIEHYRQSLSRQPTNAEAHNNLGTALKAQGRLDEAIDHYLKALSINPNYDMAHNNMGLALRDLGQIDSAVKRYRQALEISPNLAEAHNNLGNALREQGKLGEAVESHRKALLLKPDYVDAHSSLLFTLNYYPDASAEEIYRAYQEYDAKFGIPLRSTWLPHTNDKRLDRRLRVGYVSPDFRRHSCRSFLEPLLAQHDKNQVEVYAYAELDKEDDITARYQSYAEHWIPTKGMSDETLAERIRHDGIDILVELAGHTRDNRLLTFARKPAPVSVSWLGYGYTTGLGAIDYYLTDEACVPVGSEGLFAEHPWRIATPAYTYRPPEGTGEVNSLTAQQRGYITFGTLTRAVRINHRTIRVWAEILKAVPNSRLVLDSGDFNHPEVRERMVARFSEQGITRERLEIGYHSPPWNTLRSMDIGLDCFPHNSGTTLFETLYMGVPYITLAGRLSVGRLGSSILQGIGHAEWITGSEDEYVAKAVELASDVKRLSEIRSTLRGQMEKSPLMNETGFARNVEEAYRKMWHRWCEAGDTIKHEKS